MKAEANEANTDKEVFENFKSEIMTDMQDIIDKAH
jgi:hypothetical protein